MKLILTSILLMVTIMYSQDKNPITLKALYGDQEYRVERFGPARWLDGGSGYTIVEASKEFTEARDIIQYDTESGKRRVLVSAKTLIPEGAEKPLKIEDYHWSDDKKKLLIFTNTVKVWRHNTRGDYWVLDLKSKKLRQLGGDAPESTLMFAKFSPDGKSVGYVSLQNIYVEDLAGGEILQITNDGGDDIINGTSDWVYEEEFGLRDCFSWSPDSRHIAYWRFDASGIKDFYMINNTEGLYPRLIPLQYPKVGTINSECKVGVISAKGGKTTWFAVPGDPRNNYIPRMEWAESSDQVLIQQLNRLQNTNKLMLGNVKDGSVNHIYTDSDKAWVNVYKDLKWLDGGKAFTWLSEKDGWRHMYRVSRDGKQETLLTPGDYDIINVLNIDVDNGWVYFIASPENAIQRYLFRVPLDGSGKRERLTPTDQPGTHSYQVAPNSDWAFHTYSTINTPPVVDLVALPKHRRRRILQANEALHQKVANLQRRPAEFFKVDIGDGVELDAWQIKPANFDPSKKYPLFFFVYGEPAGQTVLDRWGGNRYLWHQMLANMGYLVMSVDNRGTPGPLGRAWRKSIYRQIGILASHDQAAAAKAILASHPYADPERVGIWGWSGGGSMTLNMMFRYPDIYHTGMAIAFVSNQRLYDTVYQERYMGLPDDNVEGFTQGSPITHAAGLKGNLLIIHGTGDDNVHYQSFEYLVNELIKHNKHFTMMAYPNRSHSIREGENTAHHLFQLMTRYLKENLPAGGR